MDSLWTASHPVALKCVTNRVKDWVLSDEWRLSEVPLTRLGVLNDLGPDLVLLFLFAQGEVVIVAEFFAISGSCEDCEESGDAKFEHARLRIVIIYNFSMILDSYSKDRLIIYCLHGPGK